ncbi:MAG TPA: hypothetical protein VF103_12895 [Polyangiaceae bacterium]
MVKRTFSALFVFGGVAALACSPPPAAPARPPEPPRAQTPPAAPVASAATKDAPRGPWLVPYFSELGPGTVSPDGTLMLAESINGDAFIVNLGIGAPVMALPRGTRAKRARFSPDGRRLAAIRDVHFTVSLVVAELDGERRISTFRLPETPRGLGPAEIVDWSPDGRTVSVSLPENTFVTVDARSGKLRETSAPPTKNPNPKLDEAASPTAAPPSVRPPEVPAEFLTDFRWQGDVGLLVATRKWAARVELASGRVTEWTASVPTDDYANFEVVTTCASGHWEVLSRFGRVVLASLPKKRCQKNAHLYPINLPVFEYITDTATEILDVTTGALLARFAPGPLAAPFEGSLALAVRDPKRLRCRVFDGNTRRVLETPVLPATLAGLDCRYFKDGWIVATDGLVVPGIVYVWSQKSGFVAPSGGFSKTPVPYCREAESPWDPAICVEATAQQTTIRVWDPEHGVRTATANEPLDAERALASPDANRVAVYANGRTYVANLADGSVAPWGNPGFVAQRFSDDGRTLYGERGVLTDDFDIVDDDLPFAARDGLELDPALVARENAARPKPPVHSWGFYMKAPSSPFAASRDSPVFVARVTDGRFVRVVVANVEGRPRSLIVDESGHFAGDPELERALSYATGTSLRDAVVLTGADVASEFRRPDRIREFFGARAGSGLRSLR